MAKWFRVVLTGIVALGLSGCILQSKTVLFADTEAKLLLADYPNLTTYERKDATWTKSQDQITFTPKGSHYTALADGSEEQLSFVPLNGKWWILQAIEPEKAAYYLLVRAEPKELFIYPTDCKSLQDSGKFAGAVEFKDSDCFIKPTADKMALFTAISATPGEPMTRLSTE